MKCRLASGWLSIILLNAVATQFPQILSSPEILNFQAWKVVENDIVLRQGFYAIKRIETENQCMESAVTKKIQL